MLIRGTKRGEHSLEAAPGGHVLREFADRPQSVLQIRNVQPLAVTADHVRRDGTSDQRIHL
jgi:hypothetical protein